jgi:IS5 family transposase
MIVTSGGIPLEFTFTAGSKHDLDRLRQLPVNMPEGSAVLADSAHTDYLTEERLLENGIRLLAKRKSNSMHPHNPCTEYLISVGRKQVETAFSNIAN